MLPKYMRRGQYEATIYVLSESTGRGTGIAYSFTNGWDLENPEHIRVMREHALKEANEMWRCNDARTMTEKEVELTVQLYGQKTAQI